MRSESGQRCVIEVFDERDVSRVGGRQRGSPRRDGFWICTLPSILAGNYAQPYFPPRQQPMPRGYRNPYAPSPFYQQRFDRYAPMMPQGGGGFQVAL